MYDESKVEEAFELCKNTNNYALTGSIFCNDINFIKDSEIDNLILDSEIDSNINSISKIPNA